MVRFSLFASAVSYIAAVPLTFVLAARAGLSRTMGLAAAGLALLNGRLLWAGPLPGGR